MVLNNFASGNSGHELAVGFEEVVAGEGGARRPRDGLERLVAHLAPNGGDTEEDDFDVPVGIAVTQAKNFLAHLGLDRELLV